MLQLQFSYVSSPPSSSGAELSVFLPTDNDGGGLKSLASVLERLSLGGFLHREEEEKNRRHFNCIC